MVHFSAFVTIALFFGVYASPLEQRATGVAGVQADISNISSQVSSLNSLVSSLSNTNPSLATALAIHSAAGTLVTAINNATKDVTGTTPQPVSEADGKLIINAVGGIQPTIVTALKNIVAKHPAFVILNNQLPGALTLVHGDILNLSKSASAFETAAISAAPTDLKANATKIKSTIDAAFASALAAYPS
ncbi:hydrophobic surface binding protein [Hysterangium stoloniferum]|nr:hydrophobic surface binding protein [Hysterangium stoloniferum]